MKVLNILVSASIGIFASTALSAEKCQFRNPHSFACQDATYKGLIFLHMFKPEVAAIPGMRGFQGEFLLKTVKEWKTRWTPNQYIPIEAGGVQPFNMQVDALNGVRTCGITNASDKSGVSKLIMIEPAKAGGLEIQNWKRKGQTLKVAQADNLKTEATANWIQIEHDDVVKVEGKPDDESHLIPALNSRQEPVMENGKFKKVASQEHTMSFKLGNDLFKCRVFMRTGVQHLLCKYFEGGTKIKGYLGFLPEGEEPSCAK